MKSTITKPDESGRPEQTRKISLIVRIGEWSLNHFFKTFLILLVINMFFFIAGKGVPLLLVVIAFLLLTVYIIVYLVKRIHTNMNKLLHQELKFNQIIIAYVTSVIFIVLLFSMMYWGAMITGAGYLKYGSCTDNGEITKDIINQDPLLVSNFLHYPYFSSITFFSVGFGDICPMGTSKAIAILNSIIGNAFTVLILAMAITNYSTSKRDEKKRVK